MTEWDRMWEKPYDKPELVWGNMIQSTLYSYKLVSTETLIPYARNARTHSPEQVGQIAASIKEFGFITPVIADGTNSIVCGHGRVLAAQKLGLKDVPVLEVGHLTSAQKQAYILADNKLTLNAGWDPDLLKIELTDLLGQQFDLSLLGFNPDELAGILGKNEGLTDPDDAPIAPQVPVSALGDIWVLGRHRLVCGDSCAQEATSAAMNAVSPHLMVTDPPYGVDYDAEWRNVAAAKGLIGQKKASRAIGEVLNDDQADWRAAWQLFPGDVAYIWHGATKSHLVAEGLVASGFEIRTQIIWAKNNIVISRGHYHIKHEPLFYAVRQGSTGHWVGDHKQNSLWQIDKPLKSETGHSTQKPVECMKRPIENNSSPGQAVYDPFCGSGTTIIAAEMTGRACHAIEINPAYVDVCVLRWQAFTGQTALMNGKTYEELSGERSRTAAA